MVQACNFDIVNQKREPDSPFLYTGLLMLSYSVREKLQKLAINSDFHGVVNAFDHY